MADKNFLDTVGLTYLWAKITNYVDNKSVTLPDNLVKHTALSAVTAVEKINVDTLEGHTSGYFATATLVASLQESVSAYGSTIVALGTRISDAETAIEGLQTSLSLISGNLETAVSSIATLKTSVETLETKVSNHTTSISTLESEKLSKSGGTMTGALIAQSNDDYAVAQVRNILIGTDDPDDSIGNDGDLYLKYIE